MYPDAYQSMLAKGFVVNYGDFVILTEYGQFQGYRIQGALCPFRLPGELTVMRSADLYSKMTLSRLVKVKGKYDYYSAVSDKSSNQEELNKLGVMNWHAIEYPTNDPKRYKAWFIPKKIKFALANGEAVNYNSTYVGNGDFIVAPMLTEKEPDFNNAHCVCGLVFAHTFSNRGFEKELGGVLPLITNRPNKVFDVEQISKETGYKFDALRDDIYNHLRKNLDSGQYVWLPGVIGTQLLDNAYTNTHNTYPSLNRPLLRVEETIKGDGTELSVVLYSDKGNADKNAYLCSAFYSDDYLYRIPLDDSNKALKMGVAAIREFLSIQDGGWMLGIRMPLVSPSIYRCIRNFTLDECFNRINSSIRNKRIRDMGISLFMDCCVMHDFLGLCSVGGLTLYRGMNLPSRPSVGTKILLESFSSWSLMMHQAIHFSVGDKEECVFRVISVPRNIKCAYINTISDRQDIEYEVLMDEGCTLEVVGIIKFGEHIVYDCKLHSQYHNSPFAIDRWEDEGDDGVVILSDIVRRISLSPQLSSFWYSPAQDDICMLRVMSYYDDTDVYTLKVSDHKLSVYRRSPVVSEDTVVDTELTIDDIIDDLCDFSFQPIDEETCLYGDLLGTYPFKDTKRVEQVNTVIQFLQESMRGSSRQVTRDKLYSVGISFMNNIVCRLASEYFCVLDKRFDPAIKFNGQNSRDPQKFVAYMTVATDTDASLSLVFIVDAHLSVSVMATCSNSDKGSRYHFDTIDDTIYDEIYNDVVHNYGLSHKTRVRRIFNMISAFTQTRIRKLSDYDYIMGDYTLGVKLNGNNMEWYKDGFLVHTCPYWTSVDVIASDVYEAYNKLELFC